MIMIYPKKVLLEIKDQIFLVFLKYMPSDNFDFEYQFSLNNDLKYSNSDIIKSNIAINNFITSFEYF